MTVIAPFELLQRELSGVVRTLYADGTHWRRIVQAKAERDAAVQAAAATHKENLELRLLLEQMRAEKAQKESDLAKTQPNLADETPQMLDEMAKNLQANSQMIKTEQL